MNAHEKWLRQAADEIRKEGHAGWGNTCEQAADEIKRLEAELAKRASEPQPAPREPQCPWAEDGSYCGHEGPGPCPCRQPQSGDSNG